MVIIPAILEETKEGFSARVEELLKISGVRAIQVDFCDGEFVESKSLDILQIGKLPSGTLWEAHLMVREPQEFESYLAAGFSRIIVHLESLSTAEKLRDSLAAIKKCGMQPGLAVSPGTDVAAVLPYAEQVERIMLMGVYPGRQGQTMLPDAGARVHRLRRLLRGATIVVDGGVTANNIVALYNAGADVFVVGAALQSADMAAAFVHLQNFVA